MLTNGDICYLFSKSVELDLVYDYEDWGNNTNKCPIHKFWLETEIFFTVARRILPFLDFICVTLYILR